jgi:hypothetical protein
MRCLMDLLESLSGRLQAITYEVGNHIKYFSEELYIQWAFSRAKIG